VRITLMAISPRFAISIFSNDIMRFPFSGSCILAAGFFLAVSAAVHGIKACSAARRTLWRKNFSGYAPALAGHSRHCIITTDFHETLVSHRHCLDLPSSSDCFES
jgi:hypothetical protein